MTIKEVYIMSMQAGIIGNTTRQFSAQNYFKHQTKHNNHFEKSETKRFESGDIVEFSSNVPEAFTREEFEKSLILSEKINTEKTLSSPETSDLRLDRVYAALVKLEMLNADPAQGKKVWPMGVPMPNRQELEEAYSRLTQHVSVSPAEEAEQDHIDNINSQRADLLERFRMFDFDSLV
ncbi:MAG: hypothetical protein ACYTFY_03845 [Planctomycetota bacterium]|jgi:hypothetical protein